MNYITIINCLIITTLMSCGPKKSAEENKNRHLLTTYSQTNLELKYLQTRDNYISYFKSLLANIHTDVEWSKLDRQMDSSFTILEKMLRDIMKTSQNVSISQNGKISLSSLMEGDLGFGGLDGLLLDKDSLQMFVTSKFLFNEYFKHERLNPVDNLTNKQLDNILTSALGGGEARVETLFAERKSPTKNSTVYHSIGGFGQEDVPSMGKCVFILTFKDDYVYMIWKFSSIAELQVCKSIFDKLYSDSQKYLERYHSSNLKDTTSLNKGFALQEEAVAKYCECYQKNFKNDIQFEDFQKQTDKLMKYIEK